MRRSRSLGARSRSRKARRRPDRREGRPLARINDNYLKLRGGYLFPEIGRRNEEFNRADPSGAARIIHCGIGDVSEPLPPAAVAAVHAAIDEMGRRETFRGYGPSAGYPFLREAIARGDYRGLGVDPSEIFVSEGAKGDCGSILEILGTCIRIAVADPVYPVYVDTNVMAGNTGAATGDGGYEGIVYLPGDPGNDFVPDPPRDDERVDVAYLCAPNNPPGTTITRGQLGEWVQWALDRDVLILYDVAYESFIRDDGLPHSIYEIEGARRCAMEFRSYSKSGGFTGLRCGYTICPKDLTALGGDGRRVVLHDLWTRRFNTRSNGVSYPVQRAAEALHTPAGREQVRALTDHYLGNARILRDGCEAAGLRAWGGRNAPYVWVACPDGLSSWDMFDRMLKELNVVVVPGVGFGRRGEGYIRISSFNTRPNVEQVVERLKKWRAPRHEGPKARRALSR